VAWRAYVARDIAATQEGLLAVTIYYYDDADPYYVGINASNPPGNVLWAKSWDLPIGTTVAQLQAAVVAEGQKARTYKQAEASAQTAVPKGTTVAIP